MKLNKMNIPLPENQFKFKMGEISTNQFEIITIGNEKKDWTELLVSTIKDGLMHPELKRISPYLLYDDVGSQIYTEITELEEYYLPGLEMGIFEAAGDDIIGLLGEQKMNIVELGAGDGKKTTILLRKLLEQQKDFTYIPVDISREAIVQLERVLELEREITVPTKALCGDFADCYRYLAELPEQNVFLWLGSSVGNYNKNGREEVIADIYENLKEGDLFICCFDLVKHAHTVQKAYDDSLGVSSRFAKNLFSRLNTELQGNIDPSKWYHYPIFDPALSSIKSYLVSTEKQTIKFEKIPELDIEINQWEPVLVEECHKFRYEEILELAVKNGFQVVDTFFDSKMRNYAVSVWRK